MKYILENGDFDSVKFTFDLNNGLMDRITAKIAKEKYERWGELLNNQEAKALIDSIELYERWLKDYEEIHDLNNKFRFYQSYCFWIMSDDDLTDEQKYEKYKGQLEEFKIKLDNLE